jgi:NADPH:quinone reductase-like Zn-dependent oxidoreductase
MTEQTMKAFALKSFEEPAAVHDVPVPDVGPGDLRVRVRAASINGFDVAVASGMAKGMMEHRFPVVVGKDFAGVVDAVGEGVTRFGPGDEVVGIVPTEQFLWRGSFGEYVVVPADGFVGAKPANVDFASAAGLGLAGLAALVSVDAIDPSKGDVVLVVGATGGVGAYAVQLASGRGATVIATGLPQDEAWLRELGASEVVDYTGDVAAWVGEHHPDGIDALIDFVNRDAGALTNLAEVVKDGGRLATTMGTADVEGLGARNVTATNVVAQSDPAQFVRLLQIAGEGALTVPVTRTFSLHDLHEGLELLGAGQARGKYVVTLGG